MKAPASGRITFIEDAEFHITKPYTTTLVKVREITPQDESLWATVLKMREQLKKTKGAMKYAYEDHCDQYYLNVLEDIEKTEADFDRAMKESNGK